MSLILILQAGTSLRGAAATLAVFVDHGWADFAVPASSTIRSWLLRVGDHALTRPLETSQPWLWRVDHTLQIGATKLLIILGCPMSKVPFGEHALQLADLQLVVRAEDRRLQTALSAALIIRSAPMRNQR